MHKLSLLVMSGTLLFLSSSTEAAMVSLGPHADPELLPKECMSCHEGHGQSDSAMLQLQEEQQCLICHGRSEKVTIARTRGLISSEAKPTDVETSFLKSSRHPIWQNGRHDAGEDLVLEGQRHTECADCHNHHRVGDVALRRGDQAGDSTLSVYSFEYEVCYRCHTSRSGAQLDVSLEFNVANRSFHPVEGRASGASREGLLSPWNDAEYITCSDCHSDATNGAPKGPHGSDYFPILNARYDTTRGSETPEKYGLCYQCHDREALFTTTAFPLHRQHVQQGNTPCADCHNAHGSVVNRAMLDFSLTGSPIRPAKGGQLEYRDSGPGHGTCTMSCHGVDHNGLSY